jgi:hypothetical protein
MKKNALILYTSAHSSPEQLINDPSMATGSPTPKKIVELMPNYFLEYFKSVSKIVNY